MHPVAVKCIKWAVGLFLLGALANAYGLDLYLKLADYAGVNAAAGLRLLDVVLTIMRWVTLPTGASLVGAAVVIQTLAPYVSNLERRNDQDSELEDTEID